MPSFYRYGSYGTAGQSRAEQLATESLNQEGFTGYRPVPLLPTAEALRIEALRRLHPVLAK